MKRFYSLLITGCFALGLNAQVMEFNSGASHPGFTFNGWNGSGGTIWVANLIQPATITKNTGTFTMYGFKIGPFAGGNMMMLTSDQGDTLNYNSSVLGWHTMTWAGITTLKWERTSGSGSSEDIDSVLYQPIVVGVESASHGKIDVYPNPSNGRIRVTTAKGKVAIVNPLGQVVWRKENQAFGAMVDLTSYAKGIYVIRLEDPDGRTYVSKFIVK